LDDGIISGVEAWLRTPVCSVQFRVPDGAISKLHTNVGREMFAARGTLQQVRVNQRSLSRLHFAVDIHFQVASGRMVGVL